METHFSEISGIFNLLNKPETARAAAEIQAPNTEGMGALEAIDLWVFGNKLSTSISEFSVEVFCCALYFAWRIVVILYTT